MWCNLALPRGAGTPMHSGATGLQNWPKPPILTSSKSHLTIMLRWRNVQNPEKTRFYLSDAYVAAATDPRTQDINKAAARRRVDWR